MDASQWPQEDMELLQVKPMIMGDQFASSAAKPQAVEREWLRPRPPPRLPPSKEQTLRCPRCKSTNTKFCYYNNYSLTQPRYFCKNCKRYWTEGGSLRNVPVGGGSRKNKNKTTTAGAGTAASSSKAQKLFPDQLNTNWQESSSNNSYNLSAMDLLKSSDYCGTGFGGLMQEFMRPPILSFPPETAAGNSKFMFPLEEQNKGRDGDPASSGYWNGMLMGGGSW